MRCYKCNNVLSDSDYCLKCGADVSVYKIVVKSSNTYYNLGLAKAQVRDLSGAMTALRTSIKINKNNIKARNMLGLVYYEMGETALALSEWVISANLKPDRNVALVYIKKVKSDPNRLEALNQSARRYNIALEKAKSGDDDVALIQLKKVINSTPHFIKAHLLLALLYMKRNNMDRAEKCLNKITKIDRNNTLALRYLDEIHQTGIAEAGGDEAAYYKSRKKKAQPLTGHDVIVPRSSYKEPTNGVFTVVNILLGVIIGVAVVWFLVVPSRLQSTQYENNQKLKEYSEQLSGYSITITDLESQVEDLTGQLETAQAELLAYTGDSGAGAMYARLVEAANAYVENDFETAAGLLAQIDDVATLPTEAARSLYTTMQENCESGAQTYYTAGVNAYNQRNYVDAVTYLLQAYTFDNTTVETPYYLAMSYLMLNDTTNAQTYITIVNNQFGTTTFAAQLNQYLSSNN